MKSGSATQELHVALRILTGVLALFSLALSGCVASPKDEPQVKIIDLKIRGGNPAGWIDNETFVLVMQTDDLLSGRGDSHRTVARIAAVNYRSGERKYFGKISSKLCFSDGYVSYVFLDHATGELWASHGELGREVTEKVEVGRILFDEGPNGSCRPWEERPSSPDWAKEKLEIWHLWPRLGLINCNVPSYSILNRSIRASFHDPDGESRVALPFSCYDIRKGFRYYPFKGAFFGVEYASVLPWPVGKSRRAYWLYPDGRVEVISLSYSTAIREEVIPTVHGIIAFGRPAKSHEDYGVYLVTPESTKLILHGRARGATSPDGCKVAMLHDPDFAKRVSGRRVSSNVSIKVLEICAGHKR